ncbi:MAG TPA: glutamyl-tRNA reductase, partial [Elusimicrobiota bacterium]|nr:glutamyl-tRNA reductase [Elusimicrobiota bacterium]
MSLLAIGVNHQSAAIDVRERLAFSPARLPELWSSLKSHAALTQLVVLSTCNRTELYGCLDDAESGARALTGWLQSHAPGPSIEKHLYHRRDEQAAQHLFRVAAGLDSMVVGEHEILSQVKNAYLAAHAAGATGKLLNVLFQRSLYVGKRVRSETGLSVGASSVGSLAVAMAERIFGDLRERSIMILGAGEMAELIAKHLASQKVRSILVSNRTFERAQALALQFGGRALRFEAALHEMEQADIILCSTAAPHAIIQPAHVHELMARRKGRSLFFIDIAVPRDVHPDVHHLDNVYVYNIDDLQSLVRENVAKRSHEVERAESIVREKADEFGRWLTAYDAGQGHSLRHYSPPNADIRDSKSKIL